jgi:hypothetical protein
MHRERMAGQWDPVLVEYFMAMIRARGEEFYGGD